MVDQPTTGDLSSPDNASDRTRISEDGRMGDARQGINSPHWRSQRGMAAKILAGIMVAILIVFLADLSYLFGATFRSNDRVRALNVLVVDYDGGPVGQSVANAYEALQSNQFPSFDFRSAEDYPRPSDVRNRVCGAHYWGAVYVHEGASERLAAAYAGGSAAEDFDPKDALTYIYNGARYPMIASGYLAPNFQALVGALRGSYYQTEQGRSALRSVNSSDPSAIQAYLNPIQGTADIIRPTNQGSRNLYNTLNIVMAILGQFFYVLAMNGIFDKLGIHRGMTVRDVWLFRFVTGKVFSLIFAMVVTGYIWAFREDWGLNGGHWGLTWMTFWLFMDTNFQVLESTIGSYVPLHFTPFFLLTWFIVNIASCMFPFELTAGFYRIGYAFPAHSMWIILIQVWSGCGDHLRIGLPILFAWWLVGHVTAFFGIRKRCLDQVPGPVSAEERKEEDMMTRDNGKE
ncbi:hypothetical protein ACJ41O_006366 [Fusarium nematophilum]